MDGVVGRVSSGRRSDDKPEGSMGVRFDALSFTNIASRLAPTGVCVVFGTVVPGLSR